MDIRMRKLVEVTLEYDEVKGYFFHFKNLDNDDISVISWIVNTRTDNQSFRLRIEHGESEQLTRLLNTYLRAKPFAERFDLGMVTFLFEQYALNENLYIEEATK